MKLKLLLLVLALAKCPGPAKSADLFDDQPKILVNDGNLVLESADSRNVTVRLKGNSFFLVNGVNVLGQLRPSNGSSSDSGGDSAEKIKSLQVQFSRLKASLNGQQGILNRLDRLELGIPANATIPSGTLDRTRVNALNRRISVLEMRVANLTERLMRDHCKSYPCQNGGTCFNMFETFRCECPDSWEGPTCSVDFNECAKFTETDLGCQNGATCINSAGSYECRCTDQWKGQHCTRKKMDCLNVPQSEICGHGTCVQVNNKFGYDCLCEQGWQKSNETQSCTVDIDECTAMRPHCSNDPKVMCVNTPGSFVCGQCPPGFTGNGFSCVDINECEINNGGCSVSPIVECINKRGSFKCGNCPVGYVGDGRSCTPSAIRPNLQCADNSICNENAQCVQYPNSPPTCSCKIGYSGNGYGAQGCTYVGVDACAAMRCLNGGTCMKNGTSAYCICPAGTLQPFCDQPANACISSPCLNGGTCTNIRFGRRYTCACVKGFVGVNCANQLRRCGGIRNEVNGTIRYPVNPLEPYSHNSRCAWLIKTNTSKVLNITFTKFELEPSRDCKFDWLQIHDGRSSSSHMIGRFCGTNWPKNGAIPGNIITTHNMIYLWFRSDNSTSHDGFELNWESVDPVCGGDMNITTHGTISSPGSPGNYPMNRDCQWFITAPPNKRIQFLFYTLMIESHETCAFDFVEIHSGLGSETPSLGKFCNTTSPSPLITPSHTATVHFHSDGESSDAGFQIAFSVVEGIPGCGGIYTSAKGDVVSPTNIVDGKYKHNMVCDYVIQMPKDSRVRVEFKKFALEASSLCKFDKVEIFEGSTYNEEQLIGRYCGTNAPKTITSQSNIITVKFTSDWSSNDEGFQFQYQLVCGGVYSDDSGNISSPNYPNPYAGERNCEYEIAAPLGKTIILNIFDLDIEMHSQCEFDNLEIFDGVAVDNATSMGRFCGQTKPPNSFVSTFNHLLVRFSSDASVNGRGFTANYSFVDVECGGIVKNASEIIRSPMDNDEDGTYKSNMQCRWLVYAPIGNVIQMNFLNFELEKDSACKYDFVKIFNNGSGRGEAMGPFCGVNAPKVVTTLDHIATIQFQTDSSNTKEGFTISLIFIDSSKLCGAHYFSSQGTLRSPGEPEYLPNKECEWVVTAPQNQQIEITFKYFEVESHAECRFDKLEIRNGGNSFAPLIGRFCGESVPAPIRSFSNQLHFKFTSDSSRGGKGFEIEWDATSSGCGGRITTTKGSISSPNYPESYSHNAQCEWQISVNEGSTIEIIFTDLDLESHAECKYDYLEVFDGPHASSRSKGKFCSSDNHPMYLETTGNHAMMRMNTDDSQSGRGFFLKYSIKCNRTINADSGVIESPNFPNDYPHNTDCAWTIVVSRGNKISYQFSHFHLENDNQFHNETNDHICKYDYVEISQDSEERNYEPKLKYCNGAPDAKISSGNSVTIVFHTDTSAAGSGFRMEWYVEGCGGQLTHPEGTLTSPNYPKKYSHQLTCIWEITVEYGYKIEITVNDIEMESSSSCEYDYLMISNDQNFNSSFGHICNSHSTNQKFTSNGHKLFVKFNSDDSNSAKGFNLTYKSVLLNCGGKFVTSKGIISSTGYPTHNYEKNLICEWNIMTDKSHSIVLQLLDFDLSDNCTKDFLEVLDPVYNRTLWKGCGNHLPNVTTFKSEQNAINVRLVTDVDSPTAKGFKANFSNSCGGRIVTKDTGDFEFRYTRDNTDCQWVIISEDPAKKIILTFTYVNIFLETIEGCLSKVEVFEGDSDKGPLKKTFCGSKTPPAIYSNGNALTVKLNTTSLSFVSDFDIHYSVVDNACGGDYKMSTIGEFSSPNFPESSPLNTYCIWKIGASAGHKMSLTFNQFSISQSTNCNDNYLEIRKTDQNGALVGVFCGNELPANIESSQAYWIKYQTDGETTSGGFLAEYKYTAHSSLEGSSGKIESPNYPKFFVSAAHLTYRITVKQGSLIRIEFPHFFMDEEDEDECFAYLRIYNGFDETAPQINGEICSDNPEPILTEANIVFIEFVNNHMSKTKFQLTWTEVDKVQNLTNLLDSECGEKVIFLKNDTEVVNITSPGYPYGYGTGLNCTWTIMSGLPHLHPVIVFRDVDLEDLSDCIGDYVKISADRDDGSWKEIDKLCTFDLRDKRTYDGTPNIMVQFKTDYGVNRTGFHAHTYLECGGKLTDSEGVIEYSSPSIFRGSRILNDCKWNITVRRGKTIQFEFIELNLKNGSNICNSYVIIRNGIDDSSPYLGDGQYCGQTAPTIPVTASNRAFVKFKPQFPIAPSFKLRYYEVQRECGGQIKLSRLNNSRVVSTPNYPSIPHAHIECLWTVLAPVGERIRVDFIERFDLTSAKDCSKEYVEIRDGSTKASPMIGTYCNEKPTTKRSKSNVLMMKFFTNTDDPKNGFKVNISIDVCGGTVRSNSGYLTSSNYPGLGAYPSKAQCEYRITGSPSQIFNITVTDIGLPPQNDEKKCDLTRDHIVIYSVIPDFNATSTENLIEIATLCGSTPPAAAYLSDTNEVLVKFNTFDKSKEMFKGFKLFYNASRMPCGGSVEGETGIITSPGYPTKTLNKLLCEWKITVPKGRRVKIEFLDVDLLVSNSQFLQRIGIYNDFRYSNRIVFISSNNSVLEPIYSSDNRMMITIWVRVASTNRGFKLRFSSDARTICEGGLNDDEGAIFPPIGQNLSSYSCDYYRDLKPIYGETLHEGTIAYYFKDISVGKKITNCRYASTVVNVKRRSGEAEEEQVLARICGNMTNSLTVASPFPDVNIEVRQNPFFGPINFTMLYKTHKCGGIIVDATNMSLVNLPANTSTAAVLDCAWFLRYEEGFSVSITITSLKMKLSCDEEYLNIYNGPTAIAPLIGKFCGSNVPNEQMVSQGNTIFVEYHTNNFVGSSKDSSFRVNFNSASFGCGGILNRNNFNFKTPLYGQTYPKNTECIWEIRADPGYHIGLAFVDRFFIEDSANCTNDYVEIFDLIDNEWKSLGRRCGRDVPQPFNSTSEKMRVIFRSDDKTPGDGFSAVWNQNCGGVFKVDSTKRVLSSPGFPKAYGPNLLCNYTFVAPPKSYINMNFLEFAVETTGTKCLYDNVTIYKIPDYAAYPYQIPMDKLGTFCGLTGPKSLRHRDVITVIFQSDRWVERKGFSLEYQVEECGGIITSPSMIQSPKIVTTTAYLGSMQCIWNITAPVGKKIVVKFENFSMEMSNYCSFDFVEIYNGTKVNETNRLAKICGNLTNSIRPIVLEGNQALLLFKTDQANVDIVFNAAISFKPKCDQTIQLSSAKPSHLLDMSNQVHLESMECVFKVVGEPIGSIRMTLSSIHLSRRDDTKQNGTCDYNYLEVHDGNGPFSSLIGTYCGHTIPHDVVSSSSAMYVRFASESTSSGFKATFSIIASPCGYHPYKNFTGNETSPFKLDFPKLATDKYPPNTRCAWQMEAPYGKIFDIQFLNFELEDSPDCVNDSLTIEDDNVKEYVTEGFGQEVIYRGQSQTSYQPSFYSGISGPTAPHVYCGSVIPHDYISETNKIKIRFNSNSVNEFKGFSFTVKTMSSCARNFTALTGRLVSTDVMPDCKTTIKVPANHTISLFFHRFFFYEQDCTKSFLKVYDGTFEDGMLLQTLCGYAMPNPIFSTKNQLSLFFHYDDGTTYYSKGNYDIMFIATDKGRGCGGSIYNYGGVFTSPLYPSNNRSMYDCTWTVTVPQNLRVAVRFSVFEMGSKLLCDSDYVEFLEANDQGEPAAIKKYCGEDDPAVFVSSRSTLLVHHAQTVNFAGTGWTIYFMGVKEGSKPQNW